MPIEADEWERGTAAEETWDEDNDPLGTEKRLIVSFLGEDVEKAYTKTEIIEGVEFAADDAPGTRQRVLGGIADTVLDAVSHAAAAGIVLGDLDQALDELVKAGVVEQREIDISDGTETYYRIAGTPR
jgi:hypothetical protein